ncbi:reverse transcriptase-related [Anaeramoeba flamelloides]|uniref:Reverse transcriptase-related n=1 Tax=Anaeramoeba flamelloides TaxID=1746091 RepID=A0ABQ8YZX4_9EUKA|nr:reverse transcriptase-related [Anaeramoeba flamelloides]
MFGYISHFLIEEIKYLVHHVQMFADDLILIMEGPISEIDKKLIIIYNIIQEFGMNPNTKKTLKSNQLSKIKYLGIWLEKGKHLKKNFEKVKNEDIDHFLWNCPFYEKNRKIWIKELIQINKNNKNNIIDIIQNKDSLFILSLVNDKENYDSLLKFLNKNLEIRAVRGN